ncbi:natterin-3-like [Phyllopteryx taeniolatus]|uniref:natterin-3-like n=1 Tax=Phyllopteryx taeniolatus TaxID=161469 RepID=UPI002AD379D4|nr:natterin-3-like [Phyllopteryx taeniolatus]
MNMSVALLLLVLSALASAQGPGCSKLQPVMDPALMDVVPKLSGAGLPRLVTQDTASAPRTPASVDFEGTNLEWRPWTGQLPTAAVSIYNGYSRRYDYICKHDCDSGYYNPNEGPFCVYSYGGEAMHSEYFSLLVNKDNFEILKWQEGAYGSVAWNAVKNCKDEEKYIGKNEYGLGKVQVSHRVFYLPWGKWEYIYKKDYQFLTINEDVKKDHLMDVVYHTDGVNVVEHPPDIMKNDTIKNRDCLEGTITDTITKSSLVEHKWDHSFSLTLSGNTEITTSIPFLADGVISFRLETTIGYTRGTTHTETHEHHLKLTFTVPPNSLCRIHMVGKKYGAEIPYTARLKRTYMSGETKWTTIIGTYKSTQISEVNGVLDRCEPLPNAKPCN